MNATKILWGQVLLVSFVVLAFLWGATEWVAWRLAFQSQLGRPWFEVFGWPLYQPPAFFCGGSPTTPRRARYSLKAPTSPPPAELPPLLLTAAMQALARAKSPAEFIELQQRLIKEGVEAAVSDSRHIAH
jgi:Phasin protein